MTNKFVENILNQSKSLMQTTADNLQLFFVRLAGFLRGMKDITMPVRRWVHSLWFPLTGLLPLFLISLLLVRSLPWISSTVPALIPGPGSYFSGMVDSVAISGEIEKEKANISKLEKDMARFTPRSSYLVINTSSNTFKLYNGPKLVREGVCSTGSYTLLKDGEEKKWYFQTPKGVFKIRHKTRNPVWKKPDWAFIEEGLPVPPTNHPSRIEYGTLGDYALGLGDGYLIHGTLYQRFLGLPVTHGCVRLGDDDLEAVFKAMPIGAQVYIF